MALRLRAPEILAGAVRAFAAGLGEFNAVITFAREPGQTPALLPGMYAVPEAPGAELPAAKLALGSFVPSIACPLLSGLAVR